MSDPEKGTEIETVFAVVTLHTTFGYISWAWHQAPRTSTLVSLGELHPTATVCSYLISSKYKQGQRHLMAPARDRAAGKLWIR